MKKKNLFLAGILALTLVFTLGLTSCDDTDEFDVFYGRWDDGDVTPANRYNLNISNSTFSFSYLPGAGNNLGNLEFELESLKWKNVVGGTEITGKIKSMTRGTPDPAINWTTSTSAQQLAELLAILSTETAVAPYPQSSMLPVGTTVTLFMSLSGNTLTFYGHEYTR